MIGRMRPFYQAHWDISNDIKHVWLLFCTYYIAWIFQWILGDEGMMRPSVQGVDHPVCCVLDAAVTYARDSSCWFQEGLLSSREGGGGKHTGTRLTPATCTVLDVLSFLQYRLDSGSLPSTLKMYVAAITSFHSPQGGQSIGRHALGGEFS